MTDVIPGLQRSLAEVRLSPTRIYVKSILTILESFTVKGMAHITGGGLPGNISRIIPDGLAAFLDLDRARVPKIFEVLQEMGNVPREEMHSTFNMGTGYVLVVDGSAERPVLEKLRELGETAYPFGLIGRASGEEKVLIADHP